MTTLWSAAYDTAVGVIRTGARVLGAAAVALTLLLSGRSGQAEPTLARLSGDVVPLMTAVEVTALMEDRAKVEIEVTAVVPD